VSKVADRTALVKEALAQMRAYREVYHRAGDAYRRSEEITKEAMTVYRHWPTDETRRFVEKVATEEKRAKEVYDRAVSEYTRAETAWVDAMRGREPWV
jgi:hypothetical protein